MNRLCFSSLILLCCLSFTSSAQKTEQNPATVVAGAEYKAGKGKRFFLGDHYRTEWATPVAVPILNLDTLGGLTPVEQGGGRQTKTLRLVDATGKQYVLRSVNKEYGKALPDFARGTFVEKLANDQVSTAHPFAAVTVPVMAEAAGIYHTKPIIVLVPSHPRLGAFAGDFANTLCLFEERADEDQSNAPHFGHSKNVVGTDKMFEKVYKNNKARVDQKAWIRARLFDMFLGDWGRHDDQWRWASFEQDGKTLYRPIPRDRDQTYTLFDGLIPSVVTSAESLEHLNSFSGKIKNIKKYNFPARFLDRQLTNELTLEDWVNTARSLQAALTDSIIEKAIRQMPPEVFHLSGPKIIQHLKERRAHLESYAAHYFRHLNEEVEITGSKAAEYFEVTRIDNSNTSVQVFDIDDDGHKVAAPFYSRVFKTSETDEIRLYGLAGNDRYHIKGNVQKGIKLRVIAGIDRDSLTDESAISGRRKHTLVYDNPDLWAQHSGETKLHLDADTAINRYVYNAYKPNKGSTIKTPSFRNTRGIYFNAGYKYQKFDWRREPFKWSQSLRGNYSISNGSFGGDYEGVFHLKRRWMIQANASYDQRLRHFFYGTGNETTVNRDRNYYQLFTNEGTGVLALKKAFGLHHHILFSGLYQSYRVLPGDDLYGATVLPITKPSVMERKHYAGGGLGYLFEHINNSVFPTRGFSFSVTAQHWTPFSKQDKPFQRYVSVANGYIPLSKVFSMWLKVGGSTITGDPEFYQLGQIGGGQTLRGYRRERFYGKTTFYNTNEIRWLPRMRSNLFNGHMGLVGFYDQGRVWQPGETSNTLHAGYGGGIMLIPFNRFAVTVSYGFSSEGRVLHVRVGNIF